MEGERQGPKVRQIARDIRRCYGNNCHEVRRQRELLDQEEMAQLRWEAERLRVDATKDVA